MPVRQRLWTPAFAIAFFAHFLHALAFHSFLHLPGWLLRSGITEIGIGVIVATMAGAGIAARPLIGRLTDVRGRRLILLAGGVVHVVATAAYLVIGPTGWPIYAVRLVHGVAEAMLFTVLFTIAADIVPRSRRTEGIAVFGVSGMIPLALAGMLGDAILARGDYPDLFLLATVAAALATIASLWLPESAPSKESGVGRPFFTAVAVASLRPLWFVGLAFSISLASYFTFLKTFVIDRGVGSVGSFFTAYTFIAVSLRLVLGWLPDRIGAARALLPAMLLVATGLGVLATAASDGAVIAAGFLCGAGHAFAFPIISALVVERADERERGSALAMFTALFDLGLLVGGPLFGLLLHRTDYTAMFATATVIAGGGALVWFAWEHRRAAR